jgi:hypothetical protein
MFDVSSDKFRVHKNLYLSNEELTKPYSIIAIKSLLLVCIRPVVQWAQERKGKYIEEELTTENAQKREYEQITSSNKQRDWY